PELGLVDLLLGGPELRGTLARARGEARLRRVRVAVQRGGEEGQGRRSARPGDAGRLADLGGAPGAGPRLRRERARGRRGSRRRRRAGRRQRSEEHTSELQSLAYLVCRL